MKAYISKYALSADIYEKDGEVHGRYFYPTGNDVILEMGVDAHDTREAAVAAAETMRANEIQRLERLIKKYKAFKFI